MITTGQGTSYDSRNESAIKLILLYRNDSHDQTKAESSRSFKVAYAAKISQYFLNFYQQRENFTSTRANFFEISPLENDIS